MKTHVQEYEFIRHLARPVLPYDDESRTIRSKEERRLKSPEMDFTTRTAVYMFSNNSRNIKYDITRQNL